MAVLLEREEYCCRVTPCRLGVFLSVAVTTKAEQHEEVPLLATTSHGMTTSRRKWFRLGDNCPRRSHDCLPLCLLPLAVTLQRQRWSTMVNTKEVGRKVERMLLLFVVVLMTYVYILHRYVTYFGTVLLEASAA